MPKLRAVLGTFIAALAGAQIAAAQSDAIPPYEVVPDGREYSITLGSGDRNIKKLSVFFVSTGNVSSAVEIKVKAPVGVVGSARSGYKGDEDSQAILSNASALHAAKIRNSERREKPTFSMLDPYEGYGSAYVWYHLQKDACSGNKSTKYITEVKLDLSTLDPAWYDAGFTIALSLKEYRFTGSKIASIKPSSDGKYRGEPILLMGTISYDNEYVNIVKWKRNRIVSSRRIPVVKYVSYKGYGLSLARLREVLSGGRATFELSNGGDVYGVCFTAARRRQVANGYPAP